MDIPSLPAHHELTPRSCYHPPIDPEHRRILKAMTPQQKLRAGLQLIYTARALKAAALRTQHPDWTKEQIKRAVRDIFLYARS